MKLFVKHFKELTIEELYEILKVRAAVFVVEQKCAYQDLDDKDKNAYHLYLKDEKGIQAYLRVLDKGVSYKEASVGRVLTVKRGGGLGYRILLEGIRTARQKFGADKIRISAQAYAKEFYQKAGFKQVSEEYLEDDIPHIEMLLE